MSEASRDRGFVLHSRRYKENSRLVEAFTAEHGRMSFVARVSRKHPSRDLPALQPGTESLFQWRGMKDLNNLDSADGLRFFALKGEFSVCALYCNELMLYLTDRGVPMPTLYHYYEQVLEQLGQEQPAVQCLRSFEASLLEELGSLPDYCYDAVSEQTIEVGTAIYYHPNSGVSREQALSGSLAINAEQHALLVSQHYSDRRIASLCRKLFGAQLGLLLSGRKLQSRELLRAYYRYRKPS